MTVTNEAPQVTPVLPDGAPSSEVIVKATGLKTHFPVRSRGLPPPTIAYVKAAEGVSLTINEGQTLGL